jgi:glucose/arabinose dehydrogenase
MRAGRAIATIVLCVVGLRLIAQTPLRLRVVASGFTNPLDVVQDPGDRSVQYVVEQAGRIRVLRDGVVSSIDFLDLRGAVLAGGERGLLGLAFPPDPANPHFFVNFTNRSGDTVVARFRRSANDRLVGDPGSRFDLRWSTGLNVIRQPFANHNGGHLAFGPDGYLYIGMGDGGSGNDPDARAQNPAELLGKILRIDVSVADAHPAGFEIPPDNPFAHANGTRPEIWDFGLRNPWRFTFDETARGGTGALVIGDVGQDHFEEIDYEPRGRGGRNYGWRNREGAHDNVTSRPPAFTPLIDPIFEYDHSAGQSITGGFIYRGTALGSEYNGRYFFADYVRGRVWSIAIALDPSTGEARASGLIEHTGDLGGTTQIGNVSSFGTDADGELFLLSYSRGIVFKLAGPLAPPPTPLNPRIVR